MSPQDVFRLLDATYPRIVARGRGWVLERADGTILPVPDPVELLAYTVHQPRYSQAQWAEIWLALMKRQGVPLDPSMLFYYEELLRAAETA